MAVKMNFKTGHFFLKTTENSSEFHLICLFSAQTAIEEERQREIVSAMAANKGMLLNFLFAFHLHSIPFDSTKRVNFEMVDVESAGEYVLEIQLHAAPTPKNDVLTRSKETSLHTLNAKKTK